jgi:hypothetical protein
MNLPIVLEIVLGLMFVYLTLSLIASEVQEILSTVFQWRAEHLKYSIEQLLAGDKTGLTNATQLADKLYKSPLLRNLNYEAQGRIARTGRAILHAIGSVYRTITRTRNVFDNQTSGPSYIPSETFALSLLDNLNLDVLQRLLTEHRLQAFVQDRLVMPIHHVVNDLKAGLGDEMVLSGEVRHFEKTIDAILTDYRARRMNLAQTLDRLMAELEDFSELASQVLPDTHHLTTTFLRRVQYVRSQLTGKANSAEVLLNQIQPTLRELVLLFDDKSRAFRDAMALANQEGAGATLRQVLESAKLANLPPRLQDSLLNLAEQAQQKAGIGEDSLKQMQYEVEVWFDRGMNRASGVYKRNAKFVGILIGFAIAVGLNADTFHIIQRLSVDQAVRSSIVESANQLSASTFAEASRTLVPNAPNAAADAAAPATPEAAADKLSNDLKTLSEAVNDTLQTYPLPIGRAPAVLEAQAKEEAAWPLPFGRRVLGWLITGTAISMGANFWFETLRRTLSMRSTGKPS